MDIEDLKNHTAHILGYLAEYEDYDNPIRFSSDILTNIKQINQDRGQSNRVKQTSFSVQGGSAFKIPANVSSFPYISEIKENGDIQLETIEPSTYKMKSKSTVSDEIRPTRLSNFRHEIGNINKVAFNRGIDIDNFNLINVTDAPLGREDLKHILKRGDIIPLGSNHGVYVPSFALKDATFLSLEYEGVFANTWKNTLPASQRGAGDGDFDKYVRTPVKNQFGIDTMNLLSHDAGHSFSPKAYTDGSYSAPSGYGVQEIVMGAAPLSNLVFATHAAFATWHEQGAVAPEHRKLPYNAGMHVSTTVPALSQYGTINPVTNYLKHAGIVIGTLSKTKTRMRANSYLGIPGETFSGSRNDFRVDSNTQRLECRYPGCVLDIGYVTNQLIMASKIASDCQEYAAKHKTEAHQTTHVRGSSLSIAPGISTADSVLFKPLHDPNNRAYRKTNEWFDSFMEVLGIKDRFEKDFVKNINAQCSKH